MALWPFMVFVAGIVPGVITALMFSTIILARCLHNPLLGPKGPAADWSERVRALGRLGPVAGLFLLIIGGIYAGIFTPTDPFLFPVVGELGIDPIWFGVFVVVMAELALITPPIGANVFVMRRVAPEVPMEEIFRGVLPFVFGELAMLALLIVFPELALWLVSRMA